MFLGLLRDFLLRYCATTYARQAILQHVNGGIWNDWKTNTSLFACRLAKSIASRTYLCNVLGVVVEFALSLSLSLSTAETDRTNGRLTQMQLFFYLIIHSPWNPNFANRWYLCLQSTCSITKALQRCCRLGAALKSLSFLCLQLTSPPE